MTAAPHELACGDCETTYVCNGSGIDLVPPRLREVISGDAADPAWRRWSEAISGLDRWRARRKPAPTQQVATEGPVERGIRDLCARAKLGGTVVDIGAKDGSKRALLPDDLHHYIGVEPFPQPPLPNTLVVRGFGEALPIADGAADAVLSLATLDYFVDGDAVLAEVSRVLRPGGALLVVLSVVEKQVARARGGSSFGARATGALRALPRVGVVGTAELLGGALLYRKRPNTHYYTKQQCLDLIGRHFEVESCHDLERRVSTVLFIVARKS